MRCLFRAALASLAGALILATVGLRAADFDPCSVTGIERIVAIADVHGGFAQFVTILKAADLIDDGQHWKGGRTYFVQTGDLLDRGDDSRKALDLVKRLEDEASRAGGRVVALLGNHEAMRML